MPDTESPDPQQPQAPQIQPPMAPPSAPQVSTSGTAYPAADEKPQRRSRAWIWWTLGIVIVVGILIASCALPFALMFRTPGKSAKKSSPWGVSTQAVGVITLDGVIAGTGDTYSGYITPEYFYGQFERAQDDSRVKAIVLRVDSPGGTVAASQEIASYVKNSNKPVFVSTGDVNASGAYMISSQAREIWAMPGSAVGSIGVISQIPNVSGLMDTLGVEFQVITAGENKDTGSPFRPLTKQERALIQGQVDDVYEQFIGTVAEGRKMERAEVAKLATGWTWNGEKAKELGLVDQIGTHKDALDAAAKAGGIKGDYDIVTYEEDSLDELFRSMIGFSAVLKQLSVEGALVPGTLNRSTLPR